MPNPSGRAKLIEFSSMLHPCTCAMCGRTGRTNSELFIDPAIFFEWDRVQIYFCSECITEMGSVIGLDDVAKLRGYLDNKIMECDNLKQQVYDLENVIDSLTHQRLVDRGSSVSIVSSLSYLPTGIESEINPSTSDGKLELADLTQSDSAESVNVERSDDVSEFTEHDSIINDAASLIESAGL